jgi:hypothetical protein
MRENWSRVFKGKNSLENECIALGILSARIYLGTKAGLFTSDDNGSTWGRESGTIGTSPISAIACNTFEPESVYAASVNGLFRQAGAGGWEKVFFAFGKIRRKSGEEKPKKAPRK